MCCIGFTCYMCLLDSLVQTLVNEPEAHSDWVATCALLCTYPTRLTSVITVTEAASVSMKPNAWVEPYGGISVSTRGSGWPQISGYVTSQIYISIHSVTSHALIKQLDVYSRQCFSQRKIGIQLIHLPSSLTCLPPTSYHPYLLQVIIYIYIWFLILKSFEN